ncbi:MAG TPA: N-acetylmuramoyl-L-alanine amidase, partial [Actinopolymorphaceae bacterium]
FAREAAAPVVASVREAERVRRSGPRLAGKVIVLDPGHGGSDRGACAHDLCEADVVLDLASRIEGRLAATGVRAYPTRGRFNGPSELDRARFANDIGADLLVSLHADRHPDPQASGVSTYYYGYYGPAAGRAGSGPTVVSAVGERLAGLIRRELVARTRLVDGRSHAKTWDLLRRTTMPAVRVEIGYLTNPGDAMLLSRPAFRDAVAEAVVVAIQRLYLPPDDDYPTGVLRLSDLL